MNYLTCDCVLCVLTRKNFQCRRVLITIHEKNKKGKMEVNVILPDDYEGDKDDELLNNIANLGVGIFKNEPLKRGDIKLFEGEHYRANIECIRKFKWFNCYSLCFHANLPKSLVDEEP